ncbi:F-box only protein 9 [Lutzomyia longipalpis]|uniref:F-box only protein 9 n=1 Tax=Lutzomyia longipalpis TaxID=7200 RepID=UPI002483DEEF|nr:F-box only protein 9 [Lutzomyia longipalpis]
MSTTVAAGDEESDEESSSSCHTAAENASNETLLEEFRTTWQKELQQNDLTKGIESLNLTSESDESIAKKHFLQGTEYERMGKVFEAIRHYRRAVQLVPDIEFRVRPLLAQQDDDAAPAEAGESMESEEMPDVSDTEEDLTAVDLSVRFQGILGRCRKVCERAGDERVLQTSRHLSDLPTEIILYIFKWVISRDLDVRSLEQLAGVCRGFYICARDSELWRLACSKVWGVSVGSPKAMGYLTWRQMYQERPRVHFHGCYISKTSYLRYGENSFQDQFYRPVHLIEYYRYIRFFPEGRVLMLTTPDEPINCIGKLRNRHPHKKEILGGEYEMHGDTIMVVLKRSRQRIQKATATSKRHPLYGERDTNTFYLELKIATTAKRRFFQLEWKQYSVIQHRNKTEVATDFELIPNQYPPLRFSRVKSYHAESDAPL